MIFFELYLIFLVNFAALKGKLFWQLRAKEY